MLGLAVVLSTQHPFSLCVREARVVPKGSGLSRDHSQLLFNVESDNKSLLMSEGDSVTPGVLGCFKAFT